MFSKSVPYSYSVLVQGWFPMALLTFEILVAIALGMLTKFASSGVLCALRYLCLCIPTNLRDHKRDGF